MNDQQSERQKKNALQRALAFSSRADQLVSQDYRGLGPGLHGARFILNLVMFLFFMLPLKSVYLMAVMIFRTLLALIPKNEFSLCCDSPGLYHALQKCIPASCGRIQRVWVSIVFP